MSYDISRAPAGAEAQEVEPARDDSGTQSSAKSSRRLTQVERVAQMLMDNPDVETGEFIAAYLPRFAVAIHKLRRSGWQISKRPCTEHDWHEGTAWRYRLESLPFPPNGGG